MKKLMKSCLFVFIMYKQLASIYIEYASVVYYEIATKIICARMYFVSGGKSRNHSNHVAIDPNVCALIFVTVG